MSATNPDARRPLIEQCLESVLAEGESALERWCDAHPDLAGILRKRVATLRQMGLLDSESENRDFPERLGDYRLLERIGRGGMGAVYLAECASLGRRVALKAIRSDQLFFPGARERFQREVEAIARLQVPGVVPILDVGEADGVPYYVMELLDGIDLARLVHCLRARGASPSEAGSNEVAAALRDALPDNNGSSDESGLFEGGHAHVAARIAMRLARVIARVHEHGIVHRDVKPANVIVDRFGRVTLVDFGLAHLADAADLTHSGAVLGSLPYMAPEQVRGEHSVVGPLTDVYGIGVTLHELLHLAPAFEARDAIELREHICAGRKPVRKGPRDLETITACAMDPDPARRYASADALADDLLRYLERRPVHARRSGPLLLTLRWGQRHPARATAALMLATFAIVGPTAFAIERTAAASELRAALGDTERQRGNYERTLAGALDLLDKSTLRLLAHEDIAANGELDPVRREALEAASQFYESLRVHDPDSEGIRHAVMNAKARQAEVLAMLGDLQQALALSEEVLPLTEGAPSAARLRFELRMTRGGIFDRLGDFEATAAEWRAAREEFGKVTEPDFEDRILLGRSLHGTAVVLIQNSDPGAIDASASAMEWFEGLASDYPDSARAACYVAMARRIHAQQIGRARVDQGQFDLLSRTVQELRDLSVRRPGTRQVQAELGLTLHKLADLFRYAGRDAEALPHFEEAARIQRELVRLWPDRDVVTDELATTLVDLGSSLCRMTRNADALPVLREGLALVDHRRAQVPGSVTLERAFATLHTWLAFALEHTDGTREAVLASHATAVATMQRLAEGNTGKERERRYALAAARGTAIAARYRYDDTDGLLADAELALTDMARVIELGPSDALARLQFGQMCMLCASIVIATGTDTERAAAYLRRGVANQGLTAEMLETLRGHLPDEILGAVAGDAKQ